MVLQRLIPKVPLGGVHSGPKHKFSEIIRNTRKHHFGSNGLEWMLHNFGTPKYCIQARNTSFSSFTCQVFAKCSETLANIILGQWIRTDASQLWYPELVHSGPKHKFCIFLRAEG
jgi:hypothetical protein